MESLFSRILNAKRKRVFGSKPVFKRHAAAADIKNLEAEIGALPASLTEWLVTAGYGDIDDVLSFRREWFNVIDRGELQGDVIFAQDILGNFYSFSPADGTIHFVSRTAPEFAVMATDFAAFLAELERRDFQLEEWANGQKTQPYSWGN